MDTQAPLGYLNCPYGVDARVGIPQEGTSEHIDGCRFGSLRDADCDIMSIKIDDIAPFNMEGRIVTIKRGRVLEIGMLFKNRLVERYFAIALGPIHVVEGDAGADGAYRVAHEPHGV